MMHITRLITMAENPRMIMRSFRKGNDTTIPAGPVGAFVVSSIEKMTNNKKQILQMKVNLEKKESHFILNSVL